MAEPERGRLALGDRVLIEVADSCQSNSTAAAVAAAAAAKGSGAPGSAHAGSTATLAAVIAVVATGAAQGRLSKPAGEGPPQKDWHVINLGRFTLRTMGMERREGVEAELGW